MNLCETKVSETGVLSLNSTQVPVVPVRKICTLTVHVIRITPSGTVYNYTLHTGTQQIAINSIKFIYKIYLCATCIVSLFLSLLLY